MRIATLVRRVYQAFGTRVYPGDNDIVHCEYDQRWGGTLDGPCRECSEVVAQFKGKSNRRLKPKGLSSVAFGLASLSTLAFPYWLPSFLAAVIRDPEASGALVETLEFRFRPPETDEEAAWQRSRLALLTTAEIDVLIACFEYLTDAEDFTEQTGGAIVGHLARWRPASVS